MARVDYYRDPNAPVPNSIVATVGAFVRNESGQLLLIRRTDNDGPRRQCHHRRRGQSQLAVSAPVHKLPP